MIETQIKALLDPICDGKVFALYAPQSTSPPFICYQRASTVYDDVMDGQSGYKQQSFQVDIYSRRYIESAELVETALEALTPLGISEISQQSSYESETQLYRETLEFSI